MIEVKLPREIRDFKSKVIFNLTLRQIICLVLALGINIPLYIFLKSVFIEDIASWIVLIVSLPIFLVGFVKKDGMPYEKYFLIMLRFHFLTPRIRKYKTENAFTYLLNEEKKEQAKLSLQLLKKGKINKQERKNKE